MMPMSFINLAPPHQNGPLSAVNVYGRPRLSKSFLQLGLNGAVEFLRVSGLKLRLSTPRALMEISWAGPNLRIALDGAPLTTGFPAPLLSRFSMISCQNFRSARAGEVYDLMPELCRIRPAK